MPTIEKERKLRLLIKDRAAGKTTGLIYASEATGYPIVVPTNSCIKHIKMMAQELEVTIPEPMTVEELRRPCAHKPERVLVDEVFSIIGDALDTYLGTHVVGATMTDPLKEKMIYAE